MKNKINKITRKKPAGTTVKKVIAMLSVLVFLLITYSFLIAPKTNPTHEDMQGVAFKMEMKDYRYSPPKIGDLLIEVAKKNLIMTMTSRDGGSEKGKFIFRGDKGKYGELIMFDEEGQAYYVIDDSFIEDMTERMSVAKHQMQEALDNMSEEEREAYQKAMEEAMQGGVDLDLGYKKPSTEMEVIKIETPAFKKGYFCTEFEYSRHERITRKIWTTDWDNIKGGEKAKDAFIAMGGFFESFEESIPNMFGDQNIYEKWSFKDGFPVVVKNFDENGDLEDETSLESVTTRDLNPDAFEPPSGYKRLKGPEDNK